MSISGLSPRALHKGTSALRMEGGAFTHFFAHVSLAWISWFSILAPGIFHVDHPPVLHVPCPSPSANPWPLPLLPHPPWSFLLHQPTVPFLVLPNPSLHIPRDSRYSSFWNQPLPPLSPRTSLMRVEEPLGRPLPVLGVRCLVRHTCVSVIPFPSVAASKTYIHYQKQWMFIYLFMYLFIYLFIYLQQW